MFKHTCKCRCLKFPGSDSRLYTEGVLSMCALVVSNAWDHGFTRWFPQVTMQVSRPVWKEKPLICDCVYPLVVLHSYGKSPLLIGESSTDGSFSRALIVHCRVTICQMILWPLVPLDRAKKNVRWDPVNMTAPHGPIGSVSCWDTLENLCEKKSMNNGGLKHLWNKFKPLVFVWK
jgi:hypothetical protein